MSFVNLNFLSKKFPDVLRKAQKFSPETETPFSWIFFLVAHNPVETMSETEAMFLLIMDRICQHYEMLQKRTARQLEKTIQDGEEAVHNTARRYQDVIDEADAEMQAATDKLLEYDNLLINLKAENHDLRQKLHQCQQQQIFVPPLEGSTDPLVYLVQALIVGATLNSKRQEQRHRTQDVQGIAKRLFTAALGQEEANRLLLDADINDVIDELEEPRVVNLGVDARDAVLITSATDRVLKQPLDELLVDATLPAAQRFVEKYVQQLKKNIFT